MSGFVSSMPVGAKRIFMEGCEEGNDWKVRPYVDKVSDDDKLAGFKLAAWKGHTHIVRSLLGRVSREAVESFFLRDSCIQVRAVAVLSSKVGENVRKDRFLMACSRGESLVVHGISAGGISPVLILTGINDALEGGHADIVVQLFNLLTVEDQIFAFENILKSENLQLIDALATKLKDSRDGSAYLKRVFIDECERGCLDNVRLLGRFVYYDSLREGFRAAAKAGKYDVVDHLSQGHITGEVFVKAELLRACKESGTVELIVCLFKHLSYYEDKKMVFDLLCMKSRIDAVEVLLERLREEERYKFICSGFHNAALFGDGLVVVDSLKDRILFLDLVYTFTKLVSWPGRLEYFECLLNVLLAGKAGEQIEGMEEHIPQWRQEAINEAVRNVMVAREIDKIKLLAQHVKDQDLLDEMFTFAFNQQDVDLFKYLIKWVSEGAYNSVRDQLEGCIFIAQARVRVPETEDGIDGYLADVDSFGFHLADPRFDAMHRFMIENPYVSVEN